MDRKDLSELERNLVTFIRMFQSRPFHLSKYLIENDCLSDGFINNIKNSKKLSKLSDEYQFNDLPTVYFLNFKEMLKFFEGVSREFDLSDSPNEEIVEELNSKLDELIKLEKYEEAIRIRDYMIRNNINRKT